MRRLEAYTQLAGVYDEIVVDPCHGAWAAFLDGLFAADEEGVTDVLDVCSGTGLLAAELAARGYRVTGVDASEAMLARARRLLGPDVPLIHAALPDLPVETTFDAATCTLDGFTYLPPETLRPTAEALARVLRPAGWLVFDVHTDAMMALTSSRPVVSGEKEGHRFVIRAAVDPGARRCDTRIHVTPEGTASPFSECHRQYFHRAADIRSALVDSGFEVIAVRDEYSDRPADESTLSATWIARLRR
ncbi:MAG: class I SAM-dependent DNA methyltransferase [Verrucomicrobiota bacterium]